MKEIYERVSIRRFLDCPVEEEKIEKILRAAMQAPSAGNQQPWEFYVVRDKEVLESLSKISKYAAPAKNAAAVIITVCNPEGCRFPEAAPIDTAISTEHQWLEATTQGIGGVWLCIYPFEDRVTKANEILGLTGERFAFSMLALGYPAEERKQQERFDQARIHYM